MKRPSAVTEVHQLAWVRHDSAPIRTIARAVLAGNVQYIVFDAIMKTYFAE